MDGIELDHLTPGTQPPSSSTHLDRDLPVEVDVGDDAGGAPRTPFDRAGYISLMFMEFMSPLLALGFKRPLLAADVSPLSHADSVPVVRAQFDTHWREARANGSTSILPSLIKAYWWLFFVSAISHTIYTIGSIAIPFLIQAFVKFLTGAPASPTPGYMIAVAIALTSVIMSLTRNYSFVLTTRAAQNIRDAIMAIIYAKSTRLAAWSKAASGTGETINLMSADTQRLYEAAIVFNFAWCAPLVIVFVSIALIYVMGTAAICGIVVLLLLIPLQTICLRLCAKYRAQMLAKSDARIMFTGEMLSGIRVIKQYAWEEHVAHRIRALRSTEVDTLWHMLVTSDANMALAAAWPALVAIVIFTVRSAEGYQLHLDDVFLVMPLTNLLDFNLLMFQIGLQSYALGNVSVKRISHFLTLPETEPYVQRAPVIPTGSIDINAASFRWDPASPQPLLRSISLSVRPGELIGIVGGVASGKSSMLSAMLGEMSLDGGSVHVVGSVAYTSQTCWIRNRSVRDNIVFGAPFDAVRYTAVLFAAALTHDLNMLSDGDMTEIGEQGINLSGGQKARVMFARALYSSSDIFAMDDPFAAVDLSTANTMFNHGVHRYLRGKTRILTLNSNLHLLRKADRIVVMKGDGQLGSSIADTFTSYDHFTSEYPQLVYDDDQRRKGSTAVEATGGAALDDTVDAAGVSSPETLTTVDVAGATLIEKEGQEVGSVNADVFMAYFNACSFGHGKIGLALLCVIFMLVQLIRTAMDMWSALWARSHQPHPLISMSETDWITTLWMWVIAYALLVTARVFLFTGMSVRASRTVHDTIIKRLLRAPISTFFDVTPIGRIVNRISKDMDAVDVELPNFWYQLLKYSMTLVIVAISACIASPWFILPLVPLVYIFYRVQLYFRRTSRQLKRIEGVARSPIFSAFEETLSGLATIRAHHKQAEFTRDIEEHIADNSKVNLAWQYTSRWLALRLDALCIVLIAIVAIFLVAFRSSIDSTIAAMALTYTIQLTGMLQWTVRCSVEVESNMTSVERILEYGSIPQETPVVQRGEEEEEKQAPIVPDDTWPSHGQIEFSNVCARYRPDLPLTLRGISASIRPMEKIGICGRTGSGKSSVCLTLLRMIEVDNECGGGISIDGIDIDRVDLHLLRQRISVIPQDAQLFSGTLRQNLDPYCLYSDDLLWSALEQVHMAEAVRAMPHTLDGLVAERGSNFSHGQRQLVCIARAFLRQSKIIICDEATSGIDTETDKLIQLSIRTLFRQRTVLTVAHRLDTIADSDRIMVISDGRVHELDTPLNLVNDSNSYFHDMVARSGDTGLQRFRAIAQAHTDEHLLDKEPTSNTDAIAA